MDLQSRIAAGFCGIVGLLIGGLLIAYIPQHIHLPVHPLVTGAGWVLFLDGAMCMMLAQFIHDDI